jgi:subtilase family serine protease
VWDAGDLRLGQRAVGELHPWQRSGAATPVVIPADTVPGAYFLIAAADGDAALAESSESNNAQARPVRIGFDLTVHALHAPGWATGGASIQIGDSTKNLGPGASPATTTTFYLSADPVADAGDVVLGERAIEPLPAWGRSAMVTTVTIPAGTAPGTYFLLAVVDAAGLVPELSEANNTRYRGIVIK